MTTRKQQQMILAAMFEEARRTSAAGLPIRESVLHIAQVRDDVKRAVMLGLTVTLVKDARPQKRTEEERSTISKTSRYLADGGLHEEPTHTSTHPNG